MKIQLVQEFLFTDKKDQFFKKLIKDTPEYQSFSLLRALQQRRNKLTEQQLMMLNRSDLGVKAKYWLQVLQLQNNEQRRRQACNFFSQNFFNFYFNFQRPTNILGSSEETLTSRVTYQTQLNPKTINRQQIIQIQSKSNLYFDLHLINSNLIPQYFLDQYFSKINLRIVSRIDFFPVLCKYLQQKFKTNNNFLIPNNILNSLTIQQLNNLIVKIPQLKNKFQLNSAIFSKTFANQTQQSKVKPSNTKQIKQRINILKKIRSWIKQKMPSERVLNDEMLIQILNLGLKVNQFDLQLYTQFLQTGPFISPTFNHVQLSRIQKIKHGYSVSNINQWRAVHKLDYRSWKSFQSIHQDYLQYHFRNQGKIQTFNKYFDQLFLQKKLIKSQLLQGKVVQRILDYFTAIQIDTIKQQKKLTLTKDNPQFIIPGQQVILKVQMKNIKQLQVLVYQMDMLNYYKTKLCQLSDQIKLQGIIPSQLQSFSYNDPPIRLSTRQFTFPQLKNKKGVFIIQFIGSGVMSRAIVRIGKLAIKQKVTVAGHILQIYNQNLQLCKGEQTGVYVNNIYFKTNQKGQIIIPFQQNSSNTNGIAFHKGTSSLFSIYLLKQTYNMQCKSVINKQSMMMNCKGQILLKPKLTLNGFPCTLSIIQKSSGNITITNHPNVNVNIPLQKLKFSNNNQTIIQFDVGPKISRFNLQVQFMLKSTYNQQIKLYYNQSFQFSSHQGYFKLAAQYLRRDQQGYYIQALGKNGQGKKGLICNLMFVLQGTTQTINKTLQTDSNGIIKLGHLKHVKSITSNFIQLGDIQISNQIFIIQELNQLILPNDFCQVQGINIQIPVNQKQRDIIILYKTTSQNSIIQKLNKNIQKQIGKIIIKNLSAGFYILLFQKKQIHFQIIAGKKLQNGGILQGHNIINISPKPPLFNVINQKIKSKQGKLYFYSQLINPSKSTRCHLFLSRFYSLNQFQSIMLTNINNNMNKQYISLLSKKNSYLSDKKIGDQLKYILDRKTKKIYIGNTLQRPGILLQKQYYRETHTQTQQLNQQSNFALQNRCLDQNLYYQGAPLQKCYDKSMRNKQCLKKCLFRGSKRPYSISKMHQFNGTPGFIIPNLVPNKNNQIQIQIPKGYSTLIAIFINQNQSIARTIGLPVAQLKNRDLSHKQNLKQGVFCTLKRTNKILHQGDIFQCKDVTSTQLKIIDSFQKLFSVLKTLCVTKNLHNLDWQKWQFLKQWKFLTFQKKLQKYNQFISNQFNLFLFFNDSQFFDDCISPFIQNKIKKQFIDFYFLQNNLQMKNRLNPILIDSLSNVQKVLLLHYFVTHGQQKQAKCILNLLQIKSKLIKIDKKIYKNNFDTILSQTALQNIIQNPQSFTSNSFAPLPPPIMQCYQQANFGQPFGMYNNNNNVFDFLENKANIQSMPQNDMLFGFGGGDMQYNYQLCGQMDDHYIPQRNIIKNQSTLLKGFKQLQTTKQYKQAKWKYITTNTFQFNNFFYDLAKWIYQKGSTNGFLSQNFINFGSFHDALMVLIFSDLSNKSILKTQFKDKGIIVKLQGNALVFQKQLQQTKMVQQSVSVFQKFFDKNQRYVPNQDGQLNQKRIQEYLINKVYGCQVIVTNNTINSCQLDVLGQIPHNSIPVNTIQYTKFQNMIIQPYTTQSFQYYFYFPMAGTFTIYPANVAKNGTVLATANSTIFQVKQQRKKTQLNTISDILQKGTKNDILKFVKTKNILNNKVFNFNQIYYLLKDKQFYYSLLQVLRQRGVYDQICWSFAFYHQDLVGIKQRFSFSENLFLQKLNISYFQNQLIKISKFQPTQFYPLVNQRAHSIKDNLNILNKQLRQQYNNYLIYLIQKNKHTGDDLILLVYFLTLQDRIQQALYFLKKIDHTNVSCKLQLDYFRAYFDLYDDYPNFKTARQIVQKYLSHPIQFWRNLFYDVANQLAQFDGQIPQIIDKKKLQIKQKQDLQQYLEIILESKILKISFKNLSQIYISFFPIDLQLIFSRNPFVTGGQQFTYVKPLSQIYKKFKLDKIIQNQQIQIPQQILKYNCYIQIRGGSKTVSLQYFAGQLKVQIQQNLGQLRVIDKQGKPIVKSYVKVLGQKINQQFVFFKDGYTDLRGRFDYVSKSSSSGLNQIKKFAIFVLSQAHGSIIKEAAKPSTMDRVISKVKLVNKQLNKKALQQFSNQQQVYNAKISNINKSRK